jgi:hypothetical protein
MPRMIHEDDEGLPDAAFTEDELEAGVQHIMRSGRTDRGSFHTFPNALCLSADRTRVPEDSRDTRQLRFQTYTEALEWARTHPGQPFSRSPDGTGFAVLEDARSVSESALKRVDDSLEQLSALSPHLHYILTKSISTARKDIVVPFSAPAFMADLDRLSPKDLLRLKDLLDDRVRREKEKLTWLLRAISRDYRMRSQPTGSYGEEMNRKLIGIQELAISTLDALLRKR